MFEECTMNCLIIADIPNSPDKELETFLNNQNIDCEKVSDVFTGLRRVQEGHYDIILLDTGLGDMQIKQTLRLLKGCDPDARIIVQTRNNSRDLESAIRAEQVFYYHIHSFGLEDLTTAIQSALEHARL